MPTAPPRLAEPVTLTYQESGKTDVVVSEAAMKALLRTRPWAIFCAVGMFIYALIGGFLALMWLGVVIFRHGQPGVGVLEFVILIPPNLIGSPLAFTGGVLALRYHAAVGRAYTWRNAEDLDRALIAQTRIWKWAGVAVVALFAMPPVILVVGVIAGVGK